MHSLPAAVLVAMACATAAWAAPPVPGLAGPTLSLARALELAGVRSPLVEAANADSRAAESARAVAGLRPNPGLQLDLENVAGSGAYRGTRSAEATTTLDFPIELGGKRSARIAVAEARMARASALGLLAEADLKFQVTQAYAEAAAAEKRLEIAQDQARIAAEALRAASLRVSAGRASPIEVQRAEVERIQRDVLARQAERQVGVTRSRLTRLIGAPLEGSPDPGWFGSIARSAEENAADADGSLDLVVSRADVTAAQAAVQLAQSQRVPDLTLGVGARRFSESGSAAAVVSLSVPVPLFNGGRAALSAARAEHQAAEARQRLAHQEREQAIAEADAEAADAAALAEASSGKALAAAEEAARIARIGYSHGKFGQLELLDAERSLAETRAAAIDALLATHIARARLERLTARAPIRR